nr:hypothetical protein GCM10020092_034280 [Actinoplanes digitatis]
MWVSTTIVVSAPVAATSAVKSVAGPFASSADLLEGRLDKHPRSARQPQLPEIRGKSGGVQSGVHRCHGLAILTGMGTPRGDVRSYRSFCSPHR